MSMPKQHWESLPVCDTYTRFLMNFFKDRNLGKTLSHRDVSWGVSRCCDAVFDGRIRQVLQVLQVKTPFLATDDEGNVLRTVPPANDKNVLARSSVRLPLRDQWGKLTVRNASAVPHTVTAKCRK